MSDTVKLSLPLKQANNSPRLSVLHLKPDPSPVCTCVCDSVCLCVKVSVCACTCVSVLVYYYTFDNYVCKGECVLARVCAVLACLCTIILLIIMFAVVQCYWFMWWCVCALMLLIFMFLSELIFLSFWSVEHCIMYCCNLWSAWSQRQGAREIKCQNYYYYYLVSVTP